jgi:hypothetical protein
MNGCHSSRVVIASVWAVTSPEPGVELRYRPYLQHGPGHETQNNPQIGWDSIASSIKLVCFFSV